MTPHKELSLAELFTMLRGRSGVVSLLKHDKEGILLRVDVDVEPDEFDPTLDEIRKRLEPGSLK